MAIQEKDREMCYNAGQIYVSTPTNCVHLDNGVEPKKSCISEDEVIPKARKPYTITKQRERWTEEEHKKFLEALKLYGRAWRRIEEHIGTKTAVQIRSHAQKFFSKVVREANSNLNSMNSIEIPPPRPKRKPLHPYPRKLVHQSTKMLPVSEKPESSQSPILAISEQDNLSPSSVLSAVESDTTESVISNPSNGCPSPISSATGPCPVGFSVEKQENGSLPTTSSVEKDERSPSSAPASTDSSLQDKRFMELDMRYKDHDYAKEASSAEVPTMSLKLFGRTVLVTNCQKGSPTVGDVLEHHKSHSVTDFGNKPENVELNVQEQAQESSRSAMLLDLSWGQCQSGWNPWSCGITPMYHCTPFKQAENYSEASSPIPWWVLCGSLPFPPMYCDSTPSADSSIQASCGKESNKDNIWTGSNTGSATEVGTGHRNSDAVDSQNGEEAKPISVVGLKATEGLTLSNLKGCSDGDEKRLAALCLKASENSAFSSQPVGSRNFGRGFVPYKGHVSEGQVQQFKTGSLRREGKRIQICL